MQINVTDIQGHVQKQAVLPPEIYGVPLNKAVLHSVMKSYRANRRQGNHATKTRSMVSGTGKKPLKQKGTGRARQGSRRAPHMHGGAVAHGPQPRDYRQHINKKVKTLALKIALSDKIRHQRLQLITEFGLSQHSTKTVVQTLQTLIFSQHTDSPIKHSAMRPRTLIVDHEDRDNRDTNTTDACGLLYRSTRNIHRADMLTASVLNAENVLRFEYVILTLAAFETLNARLLGTRGSL